MNKWLRDRRLNGLPTGLAIGLAGVLLVGCSSTPTYTFEGTPDSSMTGDDDGYAGDPRDVECFQIEADGQSFGEEDDDSDQQLGTFCKDSDAPAPDDDQGDD